MAQARIAGLVGSPTSVFAEQATLEQYLFTSSNGTGQLASDAASVGLHPNRKVWVVAFRGKAKLTLPSASVWCHWLDQADYNAVADRTRY